MSVSPFHRASAILSPVARAVYCAPEPPHSAVRAAVREPSFHAAHLLNASRMLSTAGPMTAMNKVGRMQKIRGMVIFTGTCCAFCSAR